MSRLTLSQKGSAGVDGQEAAQVLGTDEPQLLLLWPFHLRPPLHRYGAQLVSPKGAVMTRIVGVDLSSVELILFGALLLHERENLSGPVFVSRAVPYKPEATE